MDGNSINCTGFLLLELMVALCILVLSLLFLHRYGLQSALTKKTTTDYLQATDIAANEAERIIGARKCKLACFREGKFIVSIMPLEELSFEDLPYYTEACVKVAWKQGAEQRHIAMTVGYVTKKRV